MALLMLADLALGGALYLQGGSGFRLLAFVVFLPGAIVGFKALSRILLPRR
jgi:hypothetical protein